MSLPCEGCNKPYTYDTEDRMPEVLNCTHTVCRQCSDQSMCKICDEPITSKSTNHTVLNYIKAKSPSNQTSNDPLRKYLVCSKTNLTNSFFCKDCGMQICTICMDQDDSHSGH